MVGPPPRSTLFPYPALFRSNLFAEISYNPSTPPQSSPQPMHNSAQFRPTTHENYRPNPKEWGHEYPESFRTISTNSQLPIVLPLRPTTAQDGRKAIRGHDHQRPAVSRR